LEKRAGKYFLVRVLSAAVLSFLAILLWLGCPECGCGGAEGIRCGPPVVFAGEDFQVEAGRPVVLSAEVRLPPGDASVCVDEMSTVLFQWEQLTGPYGVELSGADYRDASFIPDRTGTYTFRLRAIYPETFINHERQVSEWDLVQVTVSPLACGDPIADPGPDRTIAAAVSTPVNLVLDGSGSHPDPGFVCRDLAIVGYRWRVAAQPAGSDVAVFNPDSLRTGAELVVPGEYRFELEVEDSAGRTGTKTMRATLVERRPCEETLQVTVVGASDGRPVAGARVTVVDAQGLPGTAVTDAQGLAQFDALSPGVRQSITAVSDQAVPALPGTGDRPRFETTTVLDHCSDRITVPLRLSASGHAAIPRGTVTAKVPAEIFDRLPHSNKRYGDCLQDEDCEEYSQTCHRARCRCIKTPLGDRQCTPKSLLPFWSLGDEEVSGQFRAVMLMPVLSADNISSLPLDRILQKPPSEDEVWPGNLATDDSWFNGLAPTLGIDPWGEPCVVDQDCPDDENYVCEQDPQGDYRCKDRNSFHNIRLSVPAGESVRIALVGGIMNPSYLFWEAILPWFFSYDEYITCPALMQGLNLTTLFVCVFSVEVAAGGETDVSASLAALSADDCWQVEYTQKEAVVGIGDPTRIEDMECAADEDCCDANDRCGWPDSGKKCLPHPDGSGALYCQVPMFRVQVISDDDVAPVVAGGRFDPRAEDADVRLRTWLPERAAYEVFCNEPPGCTWGLSYPPYHCDPPHIVDIRVPEDAECRFPYGLSIAALEFPEGHPTLPQGGRVITGFNFNQTPVLYREEPGLLVPSLNLPGLQDASVVVAQLAMRNVLVKPDGSFAWVPGSLGVSTTTGSAACGLDLPAFIAPAALGPQFDSGLDVAVNFVPEDPTEWPNPEMKQVYAEATGLLDPQSAFPVPVFPQAITLPDLEQGHLRSIVLSRVDRVEDWDGWKVLHDNQWRIYAPATTTAIPLEGGASPFSSGDEVWVYLETGGFAVPFDYDLFPVELMLRRQAVYSQDAYALVVP
jgi:hypothetical protein